MNSTCQNSGEPRGPLHSPVAGRPRSGDPRYRNNSIKLHYCKTFDNAEMLYGSSRPAPTALFSLLASLLRARRKPTGGLLAPPVHPLSEVENGRGRAALT